MNLRKIFVRSLFGIVGFILLLFLVAFVLSFKGESEFNALRLQRQQEVEKSLKIGKLKGRPFQELVDLSHVLTNILYGNERVGIRASMLSSLLNADFRYMYELVIAADESVRRCCDGPCFAAIQDTIIVSSTDETLDVFWYYEKHGKDSVLMFDMDAYRQLSPDMQ